MANVGDTGNDYIGFKLSIVTLSEMRYEGVLYNINAKHSTVSLADVKSFGTEGRSGPLGRPEVPPCDKIFKYVVFKGKDIQDLHVLSNKEINDTAIIAVNVDPETVNASLVFNADDQIKGNRGFFDNRRNQRVEFEVDPNQLRKECEEAYDFTKSKGEYDRDELRKEFENTSGNNSVYRRNILTIHSGYDQTSSFYDDISNGVNRNRTFQMRQGNQQNRSQYDMGGMRHNNQGMPNIQGMGIHNQGMHNQGMHNQGMHNQGMHNQGMHNQIHSQMHNQMHNQMSTQNGISTGIPQLGKGLVN